MSDNLERQPHAMLFEVVSYLHKKGYEKIRLMSSISPSGCHLRIIISLKKYFSNINGFVIFGGLEDEVYHYTTGLGYDFFNDNILMKNSTIEEIANKLLKKYPVFEKEGKGKDSDYVNWFNKILNLAKNDIFPYAFSDFYSIYDLGRIMLTNSHETIEYAPAGDCIDKHF